MLGATAQDYSWSHFAGAQPGGRDGAGSEARFYFSRSIVLGPDGNLVIADGLNHTIRRMTQAGTVTTIAGKAGEGGALDGIGAGARFNTPSGLAFDSQGNLFVSELSNHVIRKITPEGVVTTFAGLAGKAGSTEGPLTDARFNQPMALQYDAVAGALYVCDYNNHTIRKIDSSGLVSTFAGLSGSSGSTDGTGTEARFRNPSGICLKPSTATLFVADLNNHTIRSVSPSGSVETFAGSPGLAGVVDGQGAAARFNLPTQLCIDSAGYLYVTERNGVIRRIDQDANVATIAGAANTVGKADGPGLAARFYEPWGITSNPEGCLFLTDSLATTIRKMDAAGEVTTVAGQARHGSEDGSATDARFYFGTWGALCRATDGSFYVADTSNHTIRKVTATGWVTTYAGLAGSSGSTNGTGNEARFNAPAGIAVTSDGTVYVAERGNHTLRKISPAREVSLLAGLAGASGSTDGQGQEARFNTPFHVAVASSGDLYVTDSGNHTIRKVTPQGAVSTVAGIAGVSGGDDGAAATATFRSPSGIVVDPAGNVIIAEHENRCIRRLTPEGMVETVAGTKGTSGYRDGAGTIAQFDRPDGLCIDGAGNLFVADAGGNHAIRRVATDGTVTTVGGYGRSIGWQDGVNKPAFNLPRSVAVDSAGTLFVSDGNFCIRQGNINRALYLDGVFPSYVSIQKAFPNMTELTVEAWLRMEGDSKGTVLVDATAVSANDLCLQTTATSISIRADKSPFTLNETQTVHRPLNQQSWHHVAWVITSERGRVYLDGDLAFEVASGGSNAGYHANTPRIGGWWDGVAGSGGTYDQLFKGYLDELRVFNVARGQDEIRATMSTPLSMPTTGLVAYWNFDSGTCSDLTGNGYDGLVSGNAQIVAADVALPVPAPVSLGGLTQLAGRGLISPTVSTDPPGIAVSITYNGSLAPPSTSGEYAVVAWVTQAGYSGTATGTLRVLNPTGDNDADGLSNELEVRLAALGLDPLLAADSEFQTLRDQSLFTESDFQALAFDRPFIQRDPVTGRIQLKVGVLESPNLQNWNPLTEFHSAFLNTETGQMELELEPNGPAHFFEFYGSGP